MRLSAAMFPIELIALKQRVGQDDADADAVALPLLPYFDAAKRGQCPAPCANTIAEHLILAAVIAKRQKATAFTRIVMTAYDAMTKAMRRPTTLLDLTTGEYLAIRPAIAAYLRVLPDVEVGVMAAAQMELRRLMAL